MNQVPNIPVVIITVDELKGMIDNSVQSVKEEMKLLIRNTPIPTSEDGPVYLTADEFMLKTRIKRSRLEHLIATNSIRSVKKGRRILIPQEEAVRYFTDPTIK